MISGKCLSTLCCPETKQGLSAADASLVKKINEKIMRHEISTRGGDGIARKIDGGLVRADRQYLYPVRGGISILLIDEAIPLAGLL